MTDFVDGRLRAGKARRVALHLAACEICREEEDLARCVVEGLSSCPDVNPPEDGLHRIETRIAFSPPPSVKVIRPRFRSLAVSYAAGLASAALILIVVLPLFNGPAVVSPEDVGGVPGPAADSSPGELKPGEVPLHYLDERGESLYRFDSPPIRAADYEFK